MKAILDYAEYVMYGNAA